MNRFGEIYKNQELDPETLKMVQNAIIDAGGRNWEDLYWAAKYLYEYDQEGSSDKLIIEALDTSLSNGLNFHSNKDYFLDASRILARVYFKYQQFKHAENNLIHIRDLDEGEQPDWVFLYSATALYRIDIRRVMGNPEILFSYLDDVSSENVETEKQKIGIVKDFLNNAAQYVRTADSDSPLLNIDMPALIKSMEPYKEIVLEEWDDFLYTVQTDSLPEIIEAEQVGKDLSGILALFDSQKKLLEDLKDQISVLQHHFHQLSEEVETIKEQEKTQPGTSNVVTETISHNEHLLTGRVPKLLIFGSSRIPSNQMYGIAKSEFGLDKEQLELMLDYDENKKFNFNDIQYSSPYGGILIGPNAHKMVGVGDYSSITQRLKTEPGFPHVEEFITSSGELKITKSSYRDALRRMVAHLDSIGIH